MLEFTLENSVLKNMMAIACVATESKEASITSHCLFDLNGRNLRVYSTDKRNHMAMYSISLPEEMEGKFTADPRKIVNLLKTSDDSLKFRYDSDTLTLQISENDESFISLPSFDPKSYSSLKEDFDKSFDLKTVNASAFLSGIQFIKGFLDTKDKKFSNLYISGGIMYGSNGSNKAAAYSSPEFTGLDDLIFPVTSLSAIVELINKMDLKSILIGSSSNNIFVGTPAKDCVFGFTKVQVKMPRIPISVKEPETAGWVINKNKLMKKLGRFHITGDSGLGVKGTLSEDKLQLATIADRTSKDFIPCKSMTEGQEGTDFLTECREEINLYIDKKIILYSSAHIQTEGEEKTIPFVSAAVISLSREG